MVDQKVKAEIRKIMMDHLKSKKWPDVKEPDQLVFNELLSMWQKVEHLVPKGYTYQHFCSSAVSIYRFSELQKTFSSMLRKK